MTHRYKCVLRNSYVICCALITIAAYPDQLAQLHKQAIEQDPRFLTAQQEYDAQLQEYPIARAAYLPNLSLIYEDIDTDQDIVRSDNTVFGSGSTDFPTKNLVISLRQPIFRYDLWQTLQQSKVSVRQSVNTLAAEEQELILRVAEGYLAVLAAQDGKELAIAEKAAIDKNLQLVEARRTAGLANRVDIYDARARSSVAEVQAVEADNALLDAMLELSETVGTVPETFNSLKTTLRLTPPEPLDEDAWVEAALTQNLRLAAATSALEVASREIRVRQGQHYPSLDLVYTDSDRDTQGSLFGGGSEVKSDELMLRFQVPIYSGGGVKARVRQARSLYERTRLERELLMKQIERESRSSYRGVVTGARKVESLNRSLEAQQSALESKEKGYKAGLNTVLDILDAQRDLYFIRGEFAQARYEFLLSTLRLKSSAGILSEKDLVALDSMLNESQP